MIWVSGELNNLQIEWLAIEAVCPVSDSKELLSTKIKAVTKDLTGGGYFDDFQIRLNLTNEKLTGSEKIFLPIEESAGDIELPVFGAVVDAQIIAAHIVPKSTITGNTGSPMTLELVNKNTGDTICTKTFITGTDATAYEVTDFGPVDAGAGEIDFGYGVSLRKAGGMTLPECLIVVEWDLR